MAWPKAGHAHEEGHIVLNDRAELSIAPPAMGAPTRRIA
jgi:hypothetical protein